MIKNLRTAAAAVFSSFAALLGGGGYNITDPRRKVVEKPVANNRQTANELLSASGPTLRSYCRNLGRNNPSARAIITGLQAQIVGSGIALEPRGENVEALRSTWNKWIQHCGINGESLYELQNQTVSEFCEAGEFIWRLVYLPELASAGEIPIRILPLDSEWLVDDVVASASGFTSVSGIELDGYGRPTAYILCNPSLGSGNVERVKASEIIHRFERRRPVQNRGEPWLATSIETLMNERDLVDFELVAAKNSATPALVLESDYHEDPDADYSTDSDPVHSFRLGSLWRMSPGEKLHAHSHTRPSQQIAPFRQMLRGDLAGACRISQRYLDRDVGRANYSSLKADQIDNEKILSPVRGWLGESTSGELFTRVFPFLAVASGYRSKVVPEYMLIPDELPYLDPVKDITGALLAIRGGLSTWQKEIGKRGGDMKEVIEQLKTELSDPLLAAIFAEVSQEVAINEIEGNDAQNAPAE